MRNKIRSIAMLVGVFGLFQVTAWAQCVMCRTALASSPEGRALASSFRYGIGILLVAPYLIMGSIGYAIYRAYRKRMAARSVETLIRSSEETKIWLEEPAAVIVPREISPN